MDEFSDKGFCKKMCQAWKNIWPQPTVPVSDPCFARSTQMCTVPLDMEITTIPTHQSLASSTEALGT